MGTRKIGPAVAAGCTMVVKPATQTPLSMYALAQIMAEAGLPDGVLNVITSSHTGQVMEPLIRDPRLRKLSFTGSTEIGKRLVEQSAEQAAAGLDGARRQRAVPRVRGRRHPGGRRGRDARQDAQHGRGVHRREPLHRARVGRRRLLACGSPSGWASSPSGAAPRTASTSARWWTLPSQRKVGELVQNAVDGGATVLAGGTTVGRARLLLRPDRAHRCRRPTPGCCRRRSSALSRRSPRSARTTRRWRWPTAPSTGSSPTRSPRTSVGR